MQSRDHLAQENRKWRAVAMLFARLEQDLALLAKRPVRDANDLSVAPFVGKPVVQGEHDALLMFTRMGLPEQASALSGPLRFGYRLRGAVVEQLLWPALDVAPQTVPTAHALLENVASMEFSYLDRAGLWHTRWPLPSADMAFPSAVQVVIELKSRERITRLFALPVLL